MALESFAVGDFQSYRATQSVTFDERLTLIAGRNNVGKSALLRALRVFVEPQEGAGAAFEVTFGWRLSTEDLVERMLPPDSTAPDVVEWLRSAPSQTLRASFVRDNNLDPFVRSGNLRFIRLEVGGDAAQYRPDGMMVWESGPFQGSNIAVDLFNTAIQQLVAEVAFIAPRQIEQGLRPLAPQPILEPTGRNLTEVLLHLQLNAPLTTFVRLEQFIAETFPEIQALTIRHDESGTSSPTPGEPAIHYRHDPQGPVPLRLSGSGIEQMLALAVGILTAPPGRLFLIDEPQAYLHPHAERSLLQLLEAHPEHQYVIATNSGFLLNARSIDHARLLTISEGATLITELSSHEQFLTELQITAADLWLAESVLWVEGPSDVGIFEIVAAQLAAEKRSGLSIKKMPGAASRFTSANERRAEETYRFCREVTEAVSPLPVRMLFLFDADDKTEDVKERIAGASDGNAEFLPKRELENLFLRADLLHAALAKRCDLLELPAPDLDDVSRRLEELLALTDDRKLYLRSPGTGEEARDRVRGSEVIDRLYWDFAESEYDKLEDGKAIALLAVELDPTILDPLHSVLRRLLA